MATPTIIARDAAGNLFQSCLTDPGVKKWEGNNTTLFFVSGQWYQRLEETHIDRYKARMDPARSGPGFVDSNYPTFITREQARDWFIENLWRFDDLYDKILPDELADLRPANAPTLLNDSGGRATLRRLLELVERGIFTPSAPPADLLDAWKSALRDGLVAILHDDECTLTDKGRESLARLVEGPDHWAWPFKPFKGQMTPHCRNARARNTLTPRWNLEKYRLLLRWLTALPNPGEHFGVVSPDNNKTQEQLGYGREYYAPTAEDLAIVSYFPIQTPAILRGTRLNPNLL